MKLQSGVNVKMGSFEDDLREEERETQGDIVSLLSDIRQELDKMNHTLLEMKKQEFDYWETWRKAKEAES